MVTVSQVQHGVTTFVDRDVIPSLSGVERVVVGAGAALVASKMHAILANYADHPFFAALGVYDKERGEVDLETLYAAVKPYISNEVIPVKIPLAGVTLRISGQEVTSLYNYIREAPR